MRQSMSRKLRELVAEPGILVKPGAYNALSAKVIEAAGFQCCGISGYAVSVSLLGKPDVGFLTANELAMMTHYVTSAVNIPVLVDVDTGFGNAINVMRTTEDFIKAGAAAIHMEDQVAPKRCGHVAGKEVIPIEEAVGKYRAAAKVRDELDPDFLLLARTDARGVAGGTLEDVITRAKAYVDAGADMIFPEGLVSEEEIARVCEEVPAPVHYNRTGVSPMVSKDKLEGYGVKMVSNATGALRITARAMWDYMHGFADRDVDFVNEFLAEGKGHPTGDLHAFVGFSDIKALEEEYLPSEEVLKKYQGSLGFQP
ncbi:MAG TPA: carboxyvinyl-carboxyphosphonate phosphorylmutase [Rhodospirillaceae bacterium]|nr:carboxyvinyl-carboxyphosphonate phosphorylmutase [Rhodospirillaceae bacterium]HAT35247.1 carboxyvinyl-carboxyphosphonate phosphorylmutase [Rhodospirillaceae bacterium]